jgi:hypothetical protein
MAIENIVLVERSLMTKSEGSTMACIPVLADVDAVF